MTAAEAIQQVRCDYEQYGWIAPAIKVGRDSWLVLTDKGRHGPLALVGPIITTLYQYWDRGRRKIDRL